MAIANLARKVAALFTREKTIPPQREQAPPPQEFTERREWNYSNEDFFDGMNNRQIFDYIYKNGVWNGGGPEISSGPGSHDDNVVNPYVDAIRTFFRESSTTLTAADVGCGDFHVGSRLHGYFARYTGYDVSEVVIANNRNVFRLPGVSFETYDLSKDTLPKVDVILVRQVFQHLSNEDIKAFISRVNVDEHVQWIIITEHIPDFTFIPNMDKRTGAGVRTDKGSGVDVTKPPFELKYDKAIEVLRVPAPVNGEAASIVTTVYKLR